MLPRWGLTPVQELMSDVSVAENPEVLVREVPKLQALVYDILPSTTASYAIGSRKLSANEQFCLFVVVGAQTVVIKFVTNNSNETRRVIYSRQQSLHQHK